MSMLLCTTLAQACSPSRMPLGCLGLRLASDRVWGRVTGENLGLWRTAKLLTTLLQIQLMDPIEVKRNCLGCSTVRAGL
jgi:hypothetical protein